MQANRDTDPKKSNKNPWGAAESGCRKMRAAFLNPPSGISEARDLLYGCWCRGKRIGRASFPPLSLLYPATLLKENGHEAKLIDAQALRMDKEQAMGAIKKYDPDFLILAIDQPMQKDIAFLSETKKQNPRLQTAAFGAWTTFSPRESTCNHIIDFGIVGEPEGAILALAGREERNKQPKKGKILVSKNTENLDDLPIPDRGMLPPPELYYNPLVSTRKWTTAMTSRGCPHSCMFCTSPSFYRKKTRERSAKSVVEELAYLQGLGYREVFFRDEIFTRNEKRTREICSLILKEGIDLGWIANSHVNHAKPEILRLMEKAGCRVLKFGVESGSQRILDAYKKGITIPAIKKAFKNAHSCGIRTHAHFILGCPEDNARTLEETITLAKEIKPTTATFNPLRVMKGTPLHSAGVHPRKDAARMVRYAYQKYYVRPTYALQRIRTITSLREAYNLLYSGSAIASLKESDI